MIEKDSQLEALLFWKGEPMRRTKLMDILKLDEAGLDRTLET